MDGGFGAGTDPACSLFQSRDQAKDLDRLFHSGYELAATLVVAVAERDPQAIVHDLVSGEEQSHCSVRPRHEATVVSTVCKREDRANRRKVGCAPTFLFASLNQLAPLLQLLVRLLSHHGGD